MYKCKECGEAFSEPTYESEVVPYGSRFVGKEFSVCPYCAGEYDEAEKCKECEEYFFDYELHNGICIDCLKEEFDKLYTLFEYAETYTDKNAINDFALEVLGAERINEILRDFLKNVTNADVNALKEKKLKFIEKNAYDLAEYLEEQNEQP